MAFELTSTTTALCNSFVEKYWKMVEPVHKVQDDFTTKLNELEVELASMIFSTTSEIANQLNDLQNTTKALIPENTIDAVREVQYFIEGCDCFFTGGDEESAIGSILGSILGIYDQIDDYLGQITYPEFRAGAVANVLNKTLQGQGLGLPYGNNISELLKNADCMTTCMNGLCPATVATPEFQLILNDLQDLYNNMRLDDNPLSPNYGQIKYDELWTAAGMSTEAIVNMESTIAGIGETSNEAARGISNSVNAIKDAIAGGIF